MKKRFLSILFAIAVLFVCLAPYKATAASGTTTISGFSVSYNVIIKHHNKRTTAQVSSSGTISHGSPPLDISGSIYMVVKDSSNTMHTVPTVYKTVEYGNPYFVLCGIDVEPATVVWSTAYYNFLGTPWNLTDYSS